MVTTVYLVRHCEAEGNLRKVFQGRIDCDITERGRLQLSKLTERCKDIVFDVAYSSPLLRAYKTAEAGVANQSLPIKIHNGLIEIDGGLMEEQPWSELGNLFPDEFPLWFDDLPNFKAPNGESTREVYERVGNAFDEIVAENKGKTIGIFSHGCALRNLICRLKGMPIERIEEIAWPDNTSVTKIIIDEDDNIVFEYENDSEHIRYDEAAAAHGLWWDNSKTE